ncbi:MAG: hypothetical protein ACRC6B_07360, partial [Fusobacteriaceae bacterium]
SAEKFKDEIEEIRVEGHTSTEWTKNSTPIESYFRNMELSQDRTRATLEYVMSLESMKSYEEFMINTVTANGLSYSKKIESTKGIEDKKMSRRVEFRIRTKAEKKIDEILQKAHSGQKENNSKLEDNEIAYDQNYIGTLGTEEIKMFLGDAGYFDDEQIKTNKKRIKGYYIYQEKKREIEGVLNDGIFETLSGPYGSFQLADNHKKNKTILSGIYFSQDGKKYPVNLNLLID